MNRHLCFVELLIVLALLSVPAQAEVKIVKGRTPIPQGDCRSKDDITIVNEHFAVCFALDSKTPWSMPSGAIIDAAPVVDGEIQEDRVGFMDFLANRWKTSEPCTIETFTRETAGGGVQFQITRACKEFRHATAYTITPNDPRLEVETDLDNLTDKVIDGMQSGYSLCTRQGHVWGPVGATGNGTDSHWAPWTVGYGRTWSIGLLVPGANVLAGGASWKDMYLRHNLAPKTRRNFKAWYVFNADASLTPVLSLPEANPEDSLAQVRGTVLLPKDDKTQIPLVIASRDGHPYTWFAAPAGRFETALPASTYTLYATAANHGKSGEQTVAITADQPAEISFSAPPRPGTWTLTVQDAHTGDPTDARIVRIGDTSPAFFLDTPVRFTSFDKPGELSTLVPPGTSTYSIEAGGLGTAPVTVVLDMPEDGSLTSQVTIWTVLDRRKFGWYCADLHHHTNLVDGATHPRDSVLSQSAAGLDFVTVSDHDTVANHKDMQTFWAARSLPLIPAIEISPLWGHFNLFPLPVSHNPGIVSQSTNPDQIFAAAKKAGAYIQVNHPMEEGNAYFRSIDAGTVPGLVRMDFDFVEINGDGHFDESDQATLAKVYGFWNIGKHYCLTGGSDTHDVHSPAPDEVSGRARTCVWMGNETGSVAALMSGMKAGRSFVTLGPLLLADPIPGEGQLAAGKEATIKVQLYARHGLVSVALIKDGDTLDLHLYKDHPGKADHAFTFTPEPGSWYHIIAIDQAGNPALTNPYWVKDRGRGVKI